ncbi:MAG: filamentous hemagglutinin N-terminal domain-containing protein, partial [Gammaproteobacteria bacterium]|nr:filamentous hemagglutinin N-terminal domain-containing protein [Gammaproteobacteria bacterium]
MKQKETRKTARWDVWLLVCVLLVPAAYADITPDGSLGTLVNQVGSDFDISGGTRWDANLFHSFGVFDLNTGESATFQGPADVMRILGRVTGGSASNLDGTLRSGISGADLYLINPAGIVFGPNASLEVSGSFHVTTADYLRLGNDGRFDAAIPANSVLTAAAPSAFGFVSAAPQPIEINGSFLRTGDFSTLSVIGGDVILTDATLHAKEGRINMASVAEAGEVRPLAAGLDTGSFSSLGDIRITHSTDIDGRPTGDNFGLPLGNVDVSGDGAGDVYIRSGNFYSDNGQVFSDTQGGGAAGSIDVNVSDELKMVNEGRLIADAFFFGGAGSDISVDAGHVVLESGSTISTLTGGTGDAGNVVVNASDSISASGRSSDSDPRLLGNAR